MSDTRSQHRTVSIPTDVTNYIEWAQAQVPGAEDLSMSCIVKVICQWACANQDYLNCCIASAMQDTTSRSRPKKKG